MKNMKNLKLELFNFKNGLDIEQIDVSRIAQMHLENYDNLSEKELYESLNNTLTPYKYDPDVKKLLEGIQDEINEMPLVYELKDLYKKVERRNIGTLYRPALIKLLDVINKDNDDLRMESILNELSMYDYVPEIKQFLLKVTSTPIERQNLQNSGKAEKVYTLVENVDEGHLAFVLDRWFLISENEIKQVVTSDYIKDVEKDKTIRLLEKVLQYSNIDDNKITFKIDENLSLSVSLKNKELILNEEKLDKETTLETLFNSPIIPYLKKDYYNIIEAAINNIDKFMELDIALKVNNLLKPFTESVVFNYRDKNYVYSKDNRTGSRFVMYENVSELLNDIQNEYDNDLTFFYENKLSNEIKKLRKLDDKQQQIEIKLNDINEALKELSENEELLKENENLRITKLNLLNLKNTITQELNEIKGEKIQCRKMLL
jgi:hypothetical protein